MKYFLIIGKTPELTYAELDAYQIMFSPHKHNILIIETAEGQDQSTFESNLDELASIMKRGEVVDQTGLENVLQETKILGVDDKVKGKKWKQTFDSIRRFKEVEITKTDKDIKNKGTEVIILGSGEFGIVKGYQDIALYEHVDFGRPSSGMGIGMMPAKLTHILLNIAKGEKKHATVWDPFTGFATTNFIANACGHHTIGSDINITQAKNNFKRRQEETNKQYQADYRMTLFKHDVTQTFKKPFLRDVDCIVSEGWLGPLVSGRTHAAALQENIPKIANVYQGFLHNIFEFYKDSKNKKPTIVISVPEYQYYQGEQVQQHLEEFIGGEGYQYEFIEETYKRKGQKIGRKILIIK